ncbi:hypothetical protein VVD49_09930 [Uliginosibacterium sp. H3]|uniref:Lipoprotein n=1 Tax=Uliginosibacterium silvisoli TaxID=3114758 RepID=A0ABU6K475_9RHOO|nr:hypothetical protein [Uliginosibacterium sp. H3]
MRSSRLFVLLPLLLALAGCENSGVSYQIDGDKEHSISLLREQNVPWGKVEQSLVPARAPDCQRRVQIDPDKREFTEMKLYVNDTRLYVANQGKNWWAVGTQSCQVQKFKTPPVDPGDLIGSFKKKGDALVFEPVPEAAQ